MPLTAQFKGLVRLSENSVQDFPGGKYCLICMSDHEDSSYQFVHKSCITL